MSPPGPKKPQTRVTQARSAMVRVIVPTKLGLPNRTHSVAIHTSVAVAADRWAASSAILASLPVDRELLELDPNQLTHKSAAPSISLHGACVGLAPWGNKLRAQSNGGNHKCRDTDGNMQD